MGVTVSPAGAVAASFPLAGDAPWLVILTDSVALSPADITTGSTFVVSGAVSGGAGLSSSISPSVGSPPENSIR